jgi:hypothetical protein
MSNRESGKRDPVVLLCETADAVTLESVVSPERAESTPRKVCHVHACGDESPSATPAVSPALLLFRLLDSNTFSSRWVVPCTLRFTKKFARGLVVRNIPKVSLICYVGRDGFYAALHAHCITIDHIGIGSESVCIKYVSSVLRVYVLTSNFHRHTPFMPSLFRAAYAGRPRFGPLRG